MITKPPYESLRRWTMPCDLRRSLRRAATGFCCFTVPPHLRAARAETRTPGVPRAPLVGGESHGMAVGVTWITFGEYESQPFRSTSSLVIGKGHGCQWSWQWEFQKKQVWSLGLPYGMIINHFYLPGRNNNLIESLRTIMQVIENDSLNNGITPISQSRDNAHS